MSVANPQQANEAQAALLDQQNVTKEQKIEAASEAERTKRNILEAVKSQTVTVRVYGEEIEMSRLAGDEEDWLQDVIGGFSDVDDPDDLENDEFEEYREARERIVEMLADNAVVADFDRAFWKKLPSETRFGVVADLMNGGQEARDSGGFREK